MDYKGFKLDAGPELKLEAFSFAPGEAAKIRKLVAFAGSMSGLEFLPADIQDSPFRIEFTEEGKCRLTRTGKPDHTVVFKFEQVDDVVQAVNTLVNMSIDQHTLRPRPRATGAYNDNVPDTFDGPA